MKNLHITNKAVYAIKKARKREEELYTLKLHIQSCLRYGICPKCGEQNLTLKKHSKWFGVKIWYTLQCQTVLKNHADNCGEMRLYGNCDCFNQYFSDRCDFSGKIIEKRILSDGKERSNRYIYLFLDSFDDKIYLNFGISTLKKYTK